MYNEWTKLGLHFLRLDRFIWRQYLTHDIYIDLEKTFVIYVLLHGYIHRYDYKWMRFFFHLKLALEMGWKKIYGASTLLFNRNHIYNSACLKD